MTSTIRPAVYADRAALSGILETIELFPPEMLDDMLLPALDGEAEALWLVYAEGDTVSGFSYSVMETLTDGTWNMLAIGVHGARHGQGIGRALLDGTEAALRERGQRLLIVDTSGADDFAPVRDFYRKAGYSEEARIRDFWADGDDKVVFRKALKP